MRTHYSARLILSIIAALTLISIPFMGYLFPIFYVQTFLYDRLTIVLYPDEQNVRFVMLGCLLVFIGLVIPIIKSNKWTYAFLSICVLSGFFLVYASTLSYTYIGKEKIVSNHLFEENTIHWSDMKEVLLEYEVKDTGVREAYLFTSTNGQTIHIPLTDQFLQEDVNEIYRLAKEKNISFIEREKNR